MVLQEPGNLYRTNEIMQPLWTKKSWNLLGGENLATSWDKKNHATLQDKKNSATLQDKKKFRNLSWEKITQPVGKKLHYLSEQQKNPATSQDKNNPATSWNQKKTRNIFRQQKITQPIRKKQSRL